MTGLSSEFVQQPTRPVKDRVEARSLAQDLLDVCSLHDALGVAANQIGHPVSMFVMIQQHGEKLPLIVVNPRIVAQSGTQRGKEACLSFPGAEVSIRRPASVELLYRDLKWNLRRRQFHGLEARIVMHEISHLQGLTIFDCAD